MFLYSCTDRSEEVSGTVVRLREVSDRSEEVLGTVVLLGGRVVRLRDRSEEVLSEVSIEDVVRSARTSDMSRHI